MAITKDLNTLLTLTNINYDTFYPIWTKCNDCYKGQDAVKGTNRQLYLPKLSGHKEDETAYNTYVEYANFYPATKRTVEGLIGLVYRKDPTIINPEQIEMYINNLTASGKSLYTILKVIFREILLKYRVGVLVDYPSLNTENNDIIITKALIEKENIRAYSEVYTAETILDWRESIINNNKVLSYVKLYETKQVLINQFESNTIEQIRVLYLDESGYYKQELYEQSINETSNTVNKTKWEMVSEYYPTINNKKFDFIPFYFITPFGNQIELEEPPIESLVNVNISHFRNSANYENGLIWTGNPTPIFKGFQQNNDSIRLGSSQGILLSETGDAKYLEFTGQGLSELRTAMESKERQMSVLGARILASDPKGVESAETALIHRSGEQSVLANIANSISEVMTNAINLMALWDGLKIQENTEIIINTDYNPESMDYNMLSTLADIRERNLISWETYMYNLQRGEILPSGTDINNEIAILKEELGENAENLQGIVTVNNNTAEAEEEV